MSVDKILSAWRADAQVFGNVDSWRTLPARPARFEPIPAELEGRLAQALQDSGITNLYSHQAQAYRQAAAGRNVVVVTGTASGKTLCYNLPVVDRLLKDPDARSLYLFPTKALAQDQLSNLRALVSRVDDSAGSSGSESILPVATYDGDTPASQRPAIRSKARLLISNPDMLHMGILPHHTAWAEFFGQLKFVVLDEMHTYRGVFGSHVANVLRRLKRIARFYGAQPQFILTSATIANPQELAGWLIEEPVALVDEDGSARGSQHFLIYNPPIVDREIGLRRSSLQESVRLADDLLDYNVQTIIFGRSRRTVELILTYLRERSTSYSFDESQETIQQRVRGYRSGYLPRQRREIEGGLRQGQVRAVVATNALELGIDIGGMGAAILVGYPGTIAGTWQQAGRAGRGEQTSLSILITTAAPLDQFLASHPQYFFERSPEQALINPDNLLILLDHLRCAAFELPFRVGESFGNVTPATVQDFLDFLISEGVLHRSANQFFWMADRYPAQEISLRSASVDNVLLQSWQDGVPQTLGQIDQASAHWMVHPHAIYLHEGDSYLVEELDLEGHVARLRPIESDYYTEPRREIQVNLLEKLQEQAVRGAIKAQGEISVISQIIGYRKVRWYTHEQLGLGELNLPPTELQTTGYWLALDEQTVEALRAQGLWNSDPIDYGPNWDEMRQRARQRDEYRCRMCGAPEQGRAHDVHHKIPFRTFLSYLQANQLDNLITLCHACHRAAETAVRIRSGLAGLSFVLGHLAPFFLMCDVGDLGVHADPQSALAEGRPTVVIYDQVPAGIGFSQRLFELHDELIQRAHELVAACECTDGCPSCVGPGGENGSGGKRETLAILEDLTGFKKPARSCC
jgi:DEAD/DEAH box helicase domain-containing protein